MEKTADAKEARRHHDYSCALDDSGHAVCWTAGLNEQ
jgi:hypothetical protein